MAQPSDTRYDRVARMLHWIIGLALLGQIAFGWFLGEIPRGSPERGIAINMHKSSGLILAALIVVRILWRLGHVPPGYPASVSSKQAGALRWGHALLYACMIGLPLSGYLASNFSGHGINFLNQIPLAPWGPDDKALYGLFNGTHDSLAALFSLLVAGHILFGLYHAFIARDGLSARMGLGPAARKSPR